MQKNFSLLLGVLLIVTSSLGTAYKPMDTRVSTPEFKEELSKPEAIAAKKKLFDDYIYKTYEQIGLEEYNIDLEVFKYALVGLINLKNKNNLNNKSVITIIDFTKSSREKRFYVIDLGKRKVLYHTLVAHGEKSGGDMTTAFSNQMSSHMSSLGFYVTGETYVGSKGFSLRLDGMDRGYNDRMRERAVVIHGANYVSESIARNQNRLGRSWGCPALPTHLNKEIIELIKNKTMIFAYYDDAKFLTASRNLDEYQAVTTFDVPMT